MKSTGAILFILALAGCGSPRMAIKGSACRDCAGTVIIFLGTECPISQHYAGRLNELSRSYPQIQWAGYVPGRKKHRQIREFAREYDVQFPLRRDSGRKMTMHYGAAVTPEAFVLTRSGELVYRGAIDDWFYDFGKYRANTNKHYLRDAITSLLEGRRPPIDSTAAIGCPITRR